jgi:alkylation response protein AidB-like acyl-CoA dehydrogenase
MHFGLTEEQELLQQTVREFAAKELPAPRLRAIFEAGTGHDPALWRGAAELGIAGLIAPERYGGAGLELLDLALVHEVLGETAMPGPFLGHALAVLALARGGSDAQRERWLPRLCAGEAIGTVALAENASAWETDGWKLALGGGKLSGAKQHVPHAAGADLLVVGTRGGELALVESTARGLTVAPVDALDRTRALGSVTLDGVAAEPLGGGRELGEALLDAGRVLLAADALGAAWKLIRTTVEYTQTRQQFGQPIAQFQAIKHQLANLASEAEPLRGLVWYAAYAFDHLPAQRAASAAAAKGHVTDRAVDVGRMCVELHGGIGFTWDCDVQFWLKRATFDRTFLGTPGMQRERVAQLGGW